MKARTLIYKIYIIAVALLALIAAFLAGYTLALYHVGQENLKAAQIHDRASKP